MAWCDVVEPRTLRECRIALGESQAAFAAMLGVSPESYRTWDAGRRATPPHILARARALATHRDDHALLPLPVLALLIGEVRLAAWDEMDTAEHVWTIPATRMKMKRDHRVPLCGRALAILAAARTLGDGPLVFPSRSGRRLVVPQLRLLLARCGIACVPHGFRSSFRDWAAEETDHPREVVEAALAHRVQNPVEAAYARSDLFERRRRLMDDWASAIETRQLIL